MVISEKFSTVDKLITIKQIYNWYPFSDQHCFGTDFLIFWLRRKVKKERIWKMLLFILVVLMVNIFCARNAIGQQQCEKSGFLNNWAECKFCPITNRLDCRSWIADYPFPAFEILSKPDDTRLRTMLKTVETINLWGGCPTKWKTDKMSDYFPLLKTVNFKPEYCSNVCSPELVINNRRIGFIGSQICPSLHATLAPATLGTQVGIINSLYGISLWNSEVNIL